MGGQLDQPNIDRAISALAAAQHGVVSIAQMRRAGLGPDAVDYRSCAGRLHRVHRGVYAVGHSVLTADGRLMAATLACGDGSVVSHLTAADLWDLRPSASARIHITTPSRAGRARPGITIHRPRITANEVTRHRGIPVTTVPRTLLDIAEVLASGQLERAVDRAEALRRFDLRAVEAVLASNPHRAGARRLAAVVDEQRSLALTRNELEERFLDVCEQASIARPEVNARVECYEVDFLWRNERVIAETDGHAHHGTRKAFEDDRERDARLLTAGYRVVRFTYRQVVRNPSYVAEILCSLLAAAARSQAAAAGSNRRRSS